MEDRNFPKNIVFDFWKYVTHIGLKYFWMKKYTILLQKVPKQYYPFSRS